MLGGIAAGVVAEAEKARSKQIEKNLSNAMKKPVFSGKVLIPFFSPNSLFRAKRKSAPRTGAAEPPRVSESRAGNK